jgi:hypothetical protein
MTLPSKGRRKLVVDGVRWNWLPKARPMYVVTPSESENYVESRIVLERADRPGRRIIGIFDSRPVLPTSHRSKYVDFLVLSPALARTLVAYAQSVGWNALTAKRDLVLLKATDTLREAVVRAVGDIRRQNFCALVSRSDGWGGEARAAKEAAEEDQASGNSTTE